MNPATVKQILGEKSIIAMYRDCLKVVTLMNQDQPKAQLNIKKHFRVSFESQRHKSEEDRREFKMGIVRLLSNFTIHEIKKQYLQDPSKFERQVNVHDPKHQKQEDEAEEAASPIQLPIF